MSKVIFHVDMNAFFASVEEIKYPFLINKPFVIAERGNERSIISTCSYKAREFGIHSAMNLKNALKLCPNLIVVDGHYDEYVKMSKKIMNIFYSYSNLTLPASIDEAYIDVTSITDNYVNLAKEIQEKILKELKIPCSIGIGPTLFLAKMASDMKKPLGITIIRKSDIKDKLYNLDISDFFGIGKKTVPILNKYGIFKIGDLIDKKEILKENFSKKFCDYIYSCLSGTSSDIVDPKKNDEISSISNSRTYLEAIYDIDEAYIKLDEVAELLYPRIKKNKLLPYTITVQIRYEGFITKSKSQTYNYAIADFADLTKCSRELFDELYDQESGIRLLGISASNFYEDEYNLFTLNEKNNMLNETINNINKKIGKEIVKKLKK